MAIEVSFPCTVANSPSVEVDISERVKSKKKGRAQFGKRIRVIAGVNENSLRTYVLVDEVECMDEADGSCQLLGNIQGLA